MVVAVEMKKQVELRNVEKVKLLGLGAMQDMHIGTPWVMDNSSALVPSG